MGKAVILSVALFFSGAALFADLGDFKDAIDAAEQEARKREEAEQREERKRERNRWRDEGREHYRREHNRDEYEGDSSGGVFLSLWGIINTQNYFADYPYDGSGGYIRRDWETYNDEKNTNKYYGFSAGLQGFYLSGMGFGSWFSLNGMFYKFIGPYLDAYFVNDGKETLWGIRAGIDFSLLQFNPFSLSLYLQHQWWLGAMDNEALITGFEIRSYPVKPLALRFKGGWQILDGFSIGEMELSAGVMLKSWEIYGGYRWWTLNIPVKSVWQGPFVGLRKYF